MGSFKSIKVKHLSSSGQLLRGIDFPAGQVSVLRSLTPSELKPFQRAFAGLPGPERILITINEDPFNSFEHNVIGFGEQFKKGSETVRELLLAKGVPEDSLESIAASYGLENFLSTATDLLTAGESRMVRILAATYDDSRALILNDPFENMPAVWRERYAELVVQYARNKSAVVIVTALSSRPECWIDNELIARIQIGEMRQRTIGLAAAPSEIQAALAQLRSETNREKKEAEDATAAAALASAAALPAATLDTLSDMSMSQAVGTVAVAGESKWWHHLAAMASGATLYSSTTFKASVLGVAAVAASAVTWSLLHTSPDQVSEDVPPTEVVELAHNLPNDGNGAGGEVVAPPQTEAKNTDTASIPPVTDPAPIQEVKAEVVVDQNLLLDLYTADIKSSILASFSGENVSFPNSGEAPPTAEPAIVKSNGAGSDLFTLLQGASEKGQGGAAAGFTAPHEGEEPPSYVPETTNPVQETPSNEVESWEQRRELMRQRFLESIQAASNE